MAKLRKFLALKGEQRALLLEATLRLLQAWTVLRLLPFQKIVANLERAAPGAASPDVRPVRWAVETAARGLPLELTCLPQAFAAIWMLQARGGRPLLHYGVAKTDASFESHAWVEQGGIPVVGHGVASRFTLLATFPAQKGTAL